MERLEFLERVLAATAFDHCDALWWRGSDGTRDQPISLYINCNDIFAWACSDLERITPTNLPVLEASIQECEALGDYHWGPILFCARVRGIRPQGAVLKDIDTPEVLALFDAVGEKRPIDLGNPYQHPADGGAYAYVKTCGLQTAPAAVGEAPDEPGSPTRG
jgi:hypothetical protein